MSTTAVSLHAFAYGEHLEETSQRSLGFRLLAPVLPEPWTAEVESLARQLQAAPYPEHWPPCDLFCSVLLAGGQRLIALARYGLVDRTPSHRRGGLELVGVVGPADVDPLTARSVYEWLKRRRQTADGLEALGGEASLADVLASAPPQAPAPAEPTPVLPVQLWREGVLLFASTTPADPDLRLNLLEREAGSAWQWLPLVGADFPLLNYAERGPIIAWTPYLSSVAVKLDTHQPPPVEPAPRERRRSSSRVAVAVLLCAVAFLAGLNLWQTMSLQRQLAQLSAAPPEPKGTGRDPVSPSPEAGEREKFAEALYDLMLERSGRREWTALEPQFQSGYQQVTRDVKYRELRLAESSPRGRMAVGAADVLSRRSVDRVEEAVRRALENNKLDPKLIKAVVDTVHEQLVTDLKDGR